MIKTFKFKLYQSHRNKKLHKQINAAGLVYNHCVKLHKRYYRLYHKGLKKAILQKHITKLKKIPRFSYFLEFGSQAVQNITERIKIVISLKKYKRKYLSSFLQILTTSSRKAKDWLQFIKDRFGNAKTFKSVLRSKLACIARLQTNEKPITGILPMVYVANMH